MEPLPGRRTGVPDARPWPSQSSQPWLSSKAARGKEVAKTRTDVTAPSFCLPRFQGQGLANLPLEIMDDLRTTAHSFPEVTSPDDAFKELYRRLRLFPKANFLIDALKERLQISKLSFQRIRDDRKYRTVGIPLRPDETGPASVDAGKC